MNIKYLKGAFASLILSFSGFANASLITVDMEDRGWYSASGIHNADNQNTITGPYFQNDMNSWFIFDLTSLTGSYTSAILRLEMEIWSGTSTSGLASIWDVTSNLSDLVATHSDGVAGAAIHTDLDTGLLYSSMTVAQSDVGTIIEFDLTNALVDINNSIGGRFAVGTHLSDVSRDNWLRWSVSSEQRTHQLVLQTVDVPEPSTLAIFALGIIGLASRRFKKQS